METLEVSKAHPSFLMKHAGSNLKVPWMPNARAKHRTILCDCKRNGDYIRALDDDEHKISSFIVGRLFGLVWHPLKTKTAAFSLDLYHRSIHKQGNMPGRACYNCGQR